MNKYLLLTLLWAAWCFLHSAMISRAVTEWLKNAFGDSFRYYRLVFNAVALVTLIPVILFGASVRGPEILELRGWLRVPQVALVASAVFLFLAGGMHYDALQFLGIRQIRDHESGKGLTESGGLDTRGILGVVRHPWYAGGILIVWARDIDVSVLLTNLVLTAYFIIGSWLEERKLVVEFGDRYRQYQREVSMLFPVKWLRRITGKEMRNSGERIQ
ncbi:MAG: isoprenylcysteine carboxylmethyltransferase family protein [bacterium]|nr:MAG: isoprenylcysteine carboxylmethyltransferase family protein [bacterium]